MTDQATRIVPAGWYEDPASPAHVRWWNGLAWTEHTALKPAEQPRPQQPVAQQGYGQHSYGQQAGYGQTSTGSTQTGSTQTAETAARIAEARELERQYGISTEEHDIIIRAASHGTSDYAAGDYTPGDYRAWNDHDAEPDEPRTATASSWFIALWPVLTLIAAAAGAYAGFYLLPEPAVAGIPLIIAVAFVPLLLVLVWAALDARKLRRFGNAPASAGFAFLGPLGYLIARRTRVRGSGPLVTLVVLTVLAVGAPVAAVMTGASAPLTKALEIQQTIHADLVDGGTLSTLSCPVFVESFVQGTLYTCDATLPDGSDKLVWVSIDTHDGDFSYALAVK